MEPLHIIPSWFINFHVIFQAIFFVATAIIAGYAFMIYHLSKQKESRNLGLAFSFLSLSYLILATVNMLFLSISGNTGVLELQDITSIRMVALILYIGFIILGFVTLFYTTLKSKSAANYIVLLVLSAIAIILSSDKSLAIYLVASLFLILITINYFRNYYKTKNKNTLLISLGMLALLLANISLGASADYASPNAYVLSHFLEITGYSFVILSLVRIINNGQKKKQA